MDNQVCSECNHHLTFNELGWSECQCICEKCKSNIITFHDGTKSCSREICSTCGQAIVLTTQGKRVCGCGKCRICGSQIIVTPLQVKICSCTCTCGARLYMASFHETKGHTPFISKPGTSNPELDAEARGLEGNPYYHSHYDQCLASSGRHRLHNPKPVFLSQINSYPHDQYLDIDQEPLDRSNC